MQESYIREHSLLFKIASHSSLISVILTISWLILMVALPMPDPQSSLSERLHFIASHHSTWVLNFLNALLLTLIQIPIILGLFILTRRIHLAFSMFAGVSGLLYLIYCSLNYFFLISAIPRLAKAYIGTQDELLKYAIIANFNGWGFIQSHSLSYGLDVWGYTALSIAALLFGWTLLNSARLRRVAGWFLLVMGIVGFIGTIGYLSGHKILESGVVASGVVYLAACIVMVPMFLQESQLLEAALGKR